MAEPVPASLAVQTLRMSHALLLLPDFLLIIVGFALCHHTKLDRPVWDAAERLVYYLLFPVLLFKSSCYVRSARLRGHAIYVSGLVTVLTLLGMLGVPLSLAALGLLTIQ